MFFLVLTVSGKGYSQEGEQLCARGVGCEYQVKQTLRSLGKPQLRGSKAFVSGNKSAAIVVSKNFENIDILIANLSVDCTVSPKLLSLVVAYPDENQRFKILNDIVETLGSIEETILSVGCVVDLSNGILGLHNENLRGVVTPLTLIALPNPRRSRKVVSLETVPVSSIGHLSRHFSTLSSEMSNGKLKSSDGVYILIENTKEIYCLNLISKNRTGLSSAKINATILKMPLMEKRISVSNIDRRYSGSGEITGLFSETLSKSLTLRSPFISFCGA